MQYIGKILAVVKQLSQALPNAKSPGNKLQAFTAIVSNGGFQSVQKPRHITLDSQQSQGQTDRDKLIPIH